MADGIHGIGYGNTSGIGGGYLKQRKNENLESNNAQPQNVNQERKDVKPDDVMRFLENNNYFMPVNVEAKPGSEVGKADAEMVDRITGYMERFEEIYSIVDDEFGTEFAPAVMDLVMDKLMGMA